MSKCDSWRATPNSRYKQAECLGTRELDGCSCGGNRLKCDFYPEVREKARSEMECTSWNEATRKLYNDLDLECWGEPRKSNMKQIKNWTLNECMAECQDVRHVQPDCCDEACRLAEYGVCCKDWDLELRKKNIKAAIAHYKTGINQDIFSPEIATYAKLAVEALEKMMGDKNERSC